MEESNVINLFKRFNKATIRYCSFKSNEHLMDGIVGDTDLDILIDINDYGKAVNIFNREHFTQVEPSRVGSYPNVVNWYGIDYLTGNLIHLHLHFELMSGKSLVKDYCLPWTEYFIDNSEIDDRTSVKCVIAPLEYILLCTRMVIKRNTEPSRLVIANDTEKEIIYLKNKVEFEAILKWVRILFPESDSEKISRIIYDISNCGDSEYLWFYKCIKRELSDSQRIPERVALIQSYINRAARKLSRDINNTINSNIPLKKRFVNGGLSVAFVGIDGSGKSTVSQIITKWLSNEFDVKTYYAGAGDGKKDRISAFLLRLYGRFGGKVKGEIVATSSVENNSDVGHAKLSYKGKIKGIGSSIAYTRILSSNIRHLKQSRILASKGIVCLMDRYPQNSIPYVHDGAKIRKYDTGRGILHYYSNKERRLLDSIKETPFDIVIKLHVSGETSYKRKPQESLESLKHKEITLNSVVYDAKEVVVINAEKDLEEVLLEVKRIIWDRLSTR